ncbi:MAG: hypothetical protein OEM49_00365 [Myxococcales bacterium]|nr:hypothetical protein [Myxococcales bacterium]
MLVCKACNTRFGGTMTACPNCGRRAAEHAIEEGAPSPVSSEASPLPPAPTSASSAEPEVVLEEGAVVNRAKSPASTTNPGSTGSAGKPSPGSTGSGIKPSSGSTGSGIKPSSAGASGSAAKPPPARVHPTREPGPNVFHLSPNQVRTLIAEQPNLLGAALVLHADEKGKAAGTNFPTPVGAIDVLARDAKGNFTVIMVPDTADPDRIVPDVLQRMGWVRKHLASAGKEVHGVVVLEQLPEAVAYAAAGAAGSLTFKAYRVALSFHDVEV